MMWTTKSEMKLTVGLEQQLEEFKAPGQRQ